MKNSDLSGLGRGTNLHGGIMRSHRATLAVFAIPLFAGALGACSHANPDLAQASPPGEGTTDVGPGAGGGGPQPNFGVPVHQPTPPPPISGGTLVMAQDKNTALAADPDRDRVYIVDLAGRAVLFTVQLPKQSEPGRITVDDSGHALVVLRRSGGVATIDIATGTFTIREGVCVAPRGIAWSAAESMVHVACANGDLVSIPTVGAPTRRTLERDLRDVLINPDGTLLVTTFRSAAAIKVFHDGQLAVPPTDGTTVQWRAISLPPAGSGGGGQPCVQADCGDYTAAVVQQPTPKPVNPAPGGYGGSSSGAELSSCGPASGIVTTQLKYGGGVINLPEAVLPVDLATDGSSLAIVAAGNAFTQELPQIFVVYANDVKSTQGGCVPTVHGKVPGQATAAAFSGDDSLIVQTREPAALHIMTEDRRRPLKTIALATDSVADTGHMIFHSNAGGFIACASCHAEGTEDGHVWTFVGTGPRRTPNLLGTIKGTEPFHWDGDMKDIRDLVDHVFVERMSGPKVDDTQLGALSGWLYALPEQPKLRAASAETTAGATLFQQRCTGCHSGTMFTNNTTVDVGTGGKFQVPSLVGVAWRPSLLHTGCAHSLMDRFNPACGGNKHGDTADLTADQLTNLVKFLETL